MNAPNVTASEIDKFSQHAHQWWDAQGPLKTLHQVNPVRLAWITQHCAPQNQMIADIGCGAGILTESLARAGGLLTGVDMASVSIDVAREHAAAQGLSIDYQVKTAEHLASEQSGQYDIVTCMEMLEHVPNPIAVIESCAQLVKPDGLVFFSTLNRQPKAFLLGIVAAEYLLNWIPKGTHQYSSFIKPSELANTARQFGLEVLDIKGISYQPWPRSDQPFVVSRDVGVNYMMAFRKKA
jgi:2-polyprenyl-6-hydroxyphenyl methylase/3-demethylubiquinone-9 3-methyltransferase